MIFSTEHRQCYIDCVSTLPDGTVIDHPILHQYKWKGYYTLALFHDGDVWCWSETEGFNKLTHLIAEAGEHMADELRTWLTDYVALNVATKMNTIAQFEAQEARSMFRDKLEARGWRVSWMQKLCPALGAPEDWLPFDTAEAEVQMLAFEDQPKIRQAMVMRRLKRGTRR